MNPRTAPGDLGTVLVGGEGDRAQAAGPPADVGWNNDPVHGVSRRMWWEHRMPPQCYVTTTRKRGLSRELHGTTRWIELPADMHALTDERRAGPVNADEDAPTPCLRSACSIGVSHDSTRSRWP